MPELKDFQPDKLVKVPFWKTPWFYAICGGVVVLGVGIGVWFGYVQPRRGTTGGDAFDKIVLTPDATANAFTLTATQQDAQGVDANTTFTLQANAAIAKKDVEASLKFEPEVHFAVAETGENAFTIDPTDPLAAGTVYKASLNTTVQSDSGSEKQQFQWAFQPKTALEVEGTLPGNQATSVPLTTGIEVTFNSDGVKDFSKYFTLSPEVKGRFEQHGRTWVFVPDERLKNATIYTVTVAAALPVQSSSVTLGTDLVFQFETVASAKADDAFTYATFGRSFQSILPKEAPVLDFGFYGNLGNPKVTVHQLPTAQALMDALKPYDTIPTWAVAAQDALVISTEKLEKVGDYDAKVDTYDNQHVLRLPSGFDAGYYLLTLDVKGRKLQTVLVVSDIGAAQFVSRTDTVLWLQDLKSGTPLKSQSVEFAYDGKSYRSDDQGVVRLPTPAATIDPETHFTRSYFTLRTSEGRETILPFTPSADEGWMYWMGGKDRPTKDAYWKYMYTDRTLYHPSDTVNVWGIARPKTGNIPETLTLKVWSWNFADWRGNYVPLIEEPVELTASGTFTKALTLTQLTSGSYTVSLETPEGKEITSRTIDVQTFTKPAFGITATPLQTAGIAGTSVNVRAQTSFFDGTPAPKVRLRHANYGQAGAEGTDFTTDSQGQATYSQKLTENYHHVTTQQVAVFPPDAADGDVLANADIVVFPGQVIGSLTTKRDGNQATLTVGARNVDLTKPTDDYWNAYETMTSGPAANAPVEVKVYENVVKKTKRGTHYDFIEKTVVDVYDYSYTNELRDTITGTTDAQGAYLTTITLPGKSSHVEVHVKDSAGRYYEQTAYFGSTSYDDSANSSFHIVDTTQAKQSNAQVTYPIGAKTELEFQRNSEAVETKGAFLFITLQAGVKDVTVTAKPQLDFTFTEKDVPNVYVTGVWFTGTGFRIPNQYDQVLLQFDTDERKLDVQVTTDKPAYRPGEKVTAQVTVLDAAKKPVRARVNLSAIDEALTVIESNNAPAPLSGLHALVGTGLLQQYISHDATALESGAEGGGGGGDARKDFRDAVLFTEVETDTNGQATTTFTVPDNLTSWRLTAQAVTHALQAGHTTVGVPVSKPVFGLLTTPDEFVVDDKPVVLARAYGTGLSANDDVAFTFSTPGLGADQKKTGKPFTALSFTLPTLTVGEHELKLTVAKGDVTDTLIRKITVKSSRLSKRATTIQEATNGMTITSSSNDRTMVGVTDFGRGRVIAGLYDLQWGYGNRIERHLASRIAADALVTLKEQDAIPATGFSPTAYQQEDGGISEVVWGSSSLPLTAFAAARHDLFDGVRMYKYFLAKLSKKDVSAEDVGYALLGMANLGEPVLADLDRYTAASGVTDEQRLIAALGYAALGAGEKARAIALPLLQQYGETQDPFIRLKLGKTNDDYIVNTARFSILAEGLKLPQRLGIGRYLQENFPKDTLTNVQRSLAFVAAIPVLDATPVSVTYTAGAEAKTLSVQGSETTYVSLTTAEAKAFTVTGVTGSAGIIVQTIEPLDVASAPHDSRLGVSRTYSRVGGTGNFRQGDIVRVEIALSVHKDIIDKDFTVTDILPSGLAALPNPWNRNLQTGLGFNYPVEIAGQRLTFNTWGQNSFWYYARVVNPGRYSAEPATAQGQKSREIVNYSGGQTIGIE